MAHIRTRDETKVLSIREFLGINENPDGDTNLKTGELADMRNFRITADKHLQIRPGQKTIIDLKAVWDQLPDKPEVTPRGCGVWTGLISGKEHTVAAYGGVLWDLSPVEGVAPRDIGRATQDDTSFFGFSNKVYLLNGHEYLSWDGGAETKFTKVEGYIPTVMTATPPGGGGTKLENVNRLTGKKKVKFSPDGTATVFKLPEEDVDEIVEVVGTESTYTLGGEKKNEITFTPAPKTGTNTLIVTYRKGEGERAQVTAMHYAEFYNGDSDSRVFLYGDGSNKTIYSGNDLEKGLATAEYFPDLFEASVGEANSPITALIRHYGRLLAFKPDSAWSIDTTIVGVPGGGIVTAFPVKPVNKALGNEAMGQVKILRNNPLSFAEGGVYQWKASGNISTDHRDANRVSERVRDTLASFDLQKLKTFNFIQGSEFWILYGEKALILNYMTDTWYIYDNMPYGGMAERDGELYGFCQDGRIVHISRLYRNDDGADIDAYAETGSMDFDRDWMLKYSPGFFVAIQPESAARVNVTVETNRRSGTITDILSEAYPAKIVSAGLATFVHADFRHWSFGTNRKPQVRKVKMKVKKAAFYKIIYWSKSASATATILQTDVKLRYTGEVK